MKLNTTKRVVETDGMLKQRAFTIQNGAHIMRVLSGLYTNPVDAMIREYLTNMYDAHMALPEKMRSTVRSPELHLPTQLDPNLKFVDYGIGMSEDTVWEVYTQYGNSTKNGTNKQVGGFGLGSKTAFCYNGGSSWVVESRFKGQKHVFMAFVGADSVPSMTHVSSEPTTEPNGVTIIIPIRREDMKQCSDSARKYIPFFPLPITIHNLPFPFERGIPPIKYSLRNDSWGVRDTKSNDHVYDGSMRSTTVVMGNVPYQLDWRQMNNANGVHIWQDNTLKKELSKYIPETAFRNLGSFFSYNHFDLFVDIGSCDIVPSRDGLQYTEKTKQTVLKSIKTLVKELGGVISQQLASCKTEWEALTKYQKLNMFPYLSELSPTFEWNGIELNHSTGISRSLAKFKKLDKNMTVTFFGVPGESASGADILLDAQMDPISITIGSRDRYGVSTHRQAYVIFDDMDKGGMLMAKSFVTNKFCRKDYMGRVSSYGHTPGIGIILENSSLTPAQISEFFGGMPDEFILKTSMLAANGTPIPTALKPVKNTVYKWSRVRERFEARVQKPTDPTTKKYYLPLEKRHDGRWMYRGLNHNAKDRVLRILRVGTSFGIVTRDMDIYGVKQDEIGSLDSTWINLLDLIKDATVKKLDSLVDFYAISRRRDAYTSESSRMLNLMVDIIREMNLQKEPEFKSLIDVWNRVDTAEDVLRENDDLLKLFDDFSADVEAEFLKKVSAQKITPVDTVVAEIHTKHPMFGLLAHCYHDRYSMSSVFSSTKTQKLVLDYLRK